MKKKKGDWKRKLLITIVLVLLLLAIAIHIHTSKPIEKVNYAEIMEKKAERPPWVGERDVRWYTLNATKLERNAEVPFKVGDKYTYTGEDENNVVNDTMVFTVTGIEYVNGRDTFVVVDNWTNIERKPYGNGKTPRTERESFYYDKETGRVLKAVRGGTYHMDEAEVLSTHTAMFLYWMLSLKDGLEWEGERTLVLLNQPSKTYSKHKVLGRETVNGRECFKVELKDFSGGRLIQTYIFWVDVKDRILVRRQVSEEIMGFFREINLVSVEEA